MFKDCFIIGGGPSIDEAQRLFISVNLPKVFSIGTNLSFKFFNTTIQTVVDGDFYVKWKPQFAALPLVVAAANTSTVHLKAPNTLTLAPRREMPRSIDDIPNNVYTQRLVGAFSLSLALWLYYATQSTGRIFLFGFDFTAQGKDAQGRSRTHFYQEVEQAQHRGMGLTKLYDSANPEQFWSPFLSIKPKGVEILNASSISKIPESVFPKVTINTLQITDSLTSQVNFCSIVKNKLSPYDKKSGDTL